MNQKYARDSISFLVPVFTISQTYMITSTELKLWHLMADMTVHSAPGTVVTTYVN